MSPEEAEELFREMALLAGDYACLRREVKAWRAEYYDRPQTKELLDAIKRTDERQALHLENDL
jgi:hypothetical protein